MAMTATLSAKQTQIVGGRYADVDFILTVSNSGGAPVNVTALVPFVAPTGTKTNVVAANFGNIPIINGSGSPLFTASAAKNNVVAASGSTVFPFSVEFETPVASMKWSNPQYGARANSTPYIVGNTISLVANDNLTHLYKCTTSGTTAASQGAANGAVGYPGTSGEALTDGTAVFTEQSLGPVSQLCDVGVLCYSDDGSVFSPTAVTINCTMPTV